MTKAARFLSVLFLAGALLGAAAPVSAHGAAPPASYLTRLLSDHSDDWFGTQDGHNTIALDAYPAYNASLGGDVLVLRLILSGGYAVAGSSNPELAEHITFKANGVDQELAIKTADNLVFESELGFAAVRGPYQQLTADGTADGTRFFVEGLVPFSALGVKPGDALTDWFVTGEAGDSEGDLMPQGQVAGIPEPACAAAGECVAFDIGSYTLPNVERYVRASSPPSGEPTVPLSGDLAINLTVANLINDTAQSVTAHANGTGLLVSFGPAAPAETAMGSLDLAAAGTGTLVLHVSRAVEEDEGEGNATAHDAAHGHDHGSANATSATEPGSVTVEVLSSLGGRQLLTIPLSVTHPVPVAANETSDGHTHSEDGSKESPGLPLPVAVLALALVALRRRRA